MEIFQGKGVSSGIAFGTVQLLQKQDITVSASPVQDIDTEWLRFLDAKREADAQLETLYEKAKAELGDDKAMIIDVQRLMLEDGDFNEAIELMIKRGRFSAQYAAHETGKQFAALFSSMDDPYMKARATDASDVSRRLLDILLGCRSCLQLARPVIVVADDLTPSETLQMDKSKILAFVIRRGSANSHTAILARIMNIPCVVQSDVPLAIAGKEMVVDGESGLCYLEPDGNTRLELMEKREREQTSCELLNSMRGLPTMTKDGRIICLYANIGNVEDLDAVLRNDAEGIGLFRSEFLYLGRTDYPSEDELFNAYRKVAEGMGKKLVVIRTIDIGADKKVNYFKLDEEENPALGLRGVRVCIERTELFKTQLRAIYRASAFGNVAVMFPMIASLWEVRRCKEVAAEVRSELSGQGVYIKNIALGIMIETPAAVMTADTLAKEVDFFSVGTNDLTQYTLAVDRQNSKLEKFCDPRHPAVIEMLRLTANAAAANGIWAGVCGELAADPEMTETLVNMGYSELSVSPVFTLEMRRRIREIEHRGCST